MKKLHLSLTRKGDIDKVIKYLEDYEKDITERLSVFLEELTKIGVNAVNAQLQTISPFYKGEDIEVTDSIQQTDNGWQATITMSGQQAIFIEFGSGVLLNTSVGNSLHPWGSENGFTIGSYNSDQTNAKSPDGWWYYDKWGQSQHTLGTPTFAPLYNSSLEMLAAIREAAERVFNG